MTGVQTCALPISKRAWKVWSNESRLNIDVLDTLAISASMLQGNPMAGCIVTWLIKLGDWIRDLTAAGQKRAISELLEFQSKTAWILLDGQVISIPAAELKAGDLVVVYPGEMIPVDGEIIDGHATIDQKTITGEGLPVNRTVGETAFAATVIREGQITVRALRVGSATTAGQIVHLVESAPIGDTRMQNHAERFADRLVAPTLGLAVGTAAVTGDFNRFLSLVIVDYGTGIRVADIKQNLSYAWLLGPSALGKLILIGIYLSIKLNLGYTWLLGSHALRKLITLFIILSIKLNLGHAWLLGPHALG